jgi:hypothetical protein
MDTSKPLTPITASVTIEGPAEEILRNLRQFRGGKRSVRLSVEVSRRHYSTSDHYIPEIKDGQIQMALEKLELLSRQTIVDKQTDERLEQLIRESGYLTS